MNVGILGCGHVSDQYFSGLARYEHIAVAACADLDRKRAERKAAQRHACTDLFGRGGDVDEVAQP